MTCKLKYNCIIFAGFVVNGIFNVNVTSLERQFHLKSTELGLVAASYDLSAAFFGIFASYLGSGRYKPRWLTASAVLLAVASLLMALPHFTTEQYQWGKAYVSTCVLSGMYILLILLKMVHKYQNINFQPTTMLK